MSGPAGGLFGNPRFADLRLVTDRLQIEEFLDYAFFWQRHLTVFGAADKNSPQDPVCFFDIDPFRESKTGQATKRA